MNFINHWIPLFLLICDAPWGQLGELSYTVIDSDHCTRPTTPSKIAYLKQPDAIKSGQRANPFGLISPFTKPITDQFVPNYLSLTINWLGSTRLAFGLSSCPDLNDANELKPNIQLKWKKNETLALLVLFAGGLITSQSVILQHGHGKSVFYRHNWYPAFGLFSFSHAVSGVHSSSRHLLQLRWLLILSGSVELNPGPKTRSQSLSDHSDTLAQISDLAPSQSSTTLDDSDVIEEEIVYVLHVPRPPVLKCKFCRVARKSNVAMIQHLRKECLGGLKVLARFNCTKCNMQFVREKDADLHYHKCNPAPICPVDHVAVRTNGDFCKSVKSLLQGLTVDVDDFESIKGSGWLNGDIIEYSLMRLCYENAFHHPDKSVSYICLSPHFAQLLETFAKGELTSNQKLLPQGWFNVETVFFPVHNGNHWSLIIIQNSAKKFLHYDSIGSLSNLQFANVVCDRLSNFVKEKFGRDTYKSYSFESINGSIQHDGFNCGVYVILTAQSIVEKGCTGSFDKERCSLWRKNFESYCHDSNSRLSSSSTSMGLPLHVQGDHGSPATIFDGIGLPDQDDKVCHGNAETATGLPRPTQVDAGTPKVSQTATGFQTQAPDDTVSRNSNRYDPNFNHQGNGSPKTNQSGPGSQAQGDVGSQNKRQNGTGIPHLVGSDFRSAKNKAASTPAAPTLASSQPRQVPKLGGPDSMIRQCSGTGTQGQDLYLHLGVPTMSWIPKSARALAASLLSRLIEDVLHKNDWESWQKLMSFAPVCFQGGQKSDVKSPSLTTVTKKRVSEFESTWNVTIDRPKVGKGRKKPSPEKGLSKAVSKKIAEGDVKGAVRIASSDDKLAPATTETTKKLQQLHPDPKHPYSCSLAPNADTLRKVLVVDNVGVRRAIKSFRPGSAGGPSGLKPQHLKCLTTKNLGNPAERLVSSLTSLCNLILRGDVPAEVRPFFFGASLTALAKKNDGVRPIASGNTIRRLAAKSACHLISSEQSMQLRPLQMGVGTRNGTEAIVHAVRRFLFASEGKVIFKVDFSNAFNTVCRKAMMLQILEKTPYLYPLIWSSYSQATYLYYRGTTLLSKEGVQQGDPLGPLLFSRGIQPLISNCESELNVWYLDDGTIGGTPGTVLQDCLKIQKNARNIGLELNPSKCELSLLDFPPEESARVTTMFQQEFVGVRIVEPSSLDLLGAPLDHQQIPNALDTKIEQLKTLGHSLKNLDGHDALFLLRHCLSIPKLLYTLRCTPCFLAPASLKMYDVKIKTILEEILNVRIDDKAWAQANLPVKYGGLGVRKATDVAIPAYMASINQCRVLCKQIWEGASHESDRVEEMGLEVWARNGLNRPKEPKCQREWDHTACEKQCQSLLDKSKDIQEDRARLLASTAEGSGDWLNAFPIPSLGLKLSSSDLRIAISLRLGLQMCETHSCICGKRVDQSGAHGLSCGKSKGRIPRHAMVNDLIKRALVSAGIPSILEPVGLSTADGKRPDGLTLIPWEHGRCLAWDFTCPDTMAPSHLVNTSIRKSGAAKEAENHKLAKYYQITGTHIVVPVGIETLGSYGPSASSFITTLGRKIRAETGEKNAGAYLRQAIGIAIQRGNAVSVMGTLPCTKALEEIYYTF